MMIFDIIAYFLTTVYFLNYGI